MTKIKRERNEYVNNKRFLSALIDHKNKVENAKLNNLPTPILSDYIGECFVYIATRYARKPNFSGYPFKDEMVNDAIENCVRYYYNFDPEKSNNPFAYFTRTVHNAFLRRIDKEKEELYMKFKNLENFMITNVDSHDINNGMLNNANSIDLDTDYMKNFINEYEKRVEKKKEASRERIREKKKQEEL